MVPTWKDAADRWLKEMSHKRTIDQDARKFKEIGKYLNDKQFDSIQQADISRIKTEKTVPGQSSATLNRILSLLKAVFRKAEREWGWQCNPIYIKLSKEPQGRTRWLSRDEVDRLLKELPIHLAYLVEFSLATGQRAGNVLGARWRDIDLERKIWTIRGEDFKNGKEHCVPLNKAAMNILWLNKDKHDTWVFSYKGNRIRQCNTKAFRNALKRAGILNFRFHDLRHTWASQLVQAGVDLYTIQKLGGWSTINMVQKYSHHNNQQLAEAMEKIV